MDLVRSQPEARSSQLLYKTLPRLTDSLPHLSQTRVSMNVAPVSATPDLEEANMSKRTQFWMIGGALVLALAVAGAAVAQGMHHGMDHGFDFDRMLSHYAD